MRNKEETIYCYSEAERDAAVKKMGKKREITRFKGLGEISPAEFKQFIGKDMRLSQVEYAPKPEAAGHPQLLHGQEHARAQGLHHGESGGAGGGVIRPKSLQPFQCSQTSRRMPGCRSRSRTV